MLNKTQVRVLAALTETVATRKDGVTVSATGDTSTTTGYAVGGTVPELVITDGTTDGIAEWVADWVDYYAGENYGAWYDSATGYYHIDGSNHLDSRDHALELARSRGEIAVYDLANGCEIRV